MTGFEIVYVGGDDIGERRAQAARGHRHDPNPATRQEPEVRARAVVATKTADHPLSLVAADIPACAPAFAIEEGKSLCLIPCLPGNKLMAARHRGLQIGRASCRERV